MRMPVGSELQWKRFTSSNIVEVATLPERIDLVHSKMCPIQFQIMSDLHLETPRARPTYKEFEIKPQCQHLALLGDIGNVSDPRLFTFLEEQLRQFEIVFFLLGNHEPYGTTFPIAQASVRAFEKDMERLRLPPSSNTGRFVFLDRTRYDFTDNVTVLGCTLYSRVLLEQRDSVTRFVSDFSNIEDWNVDLHCAAHQVDLHWLNAQVTHITQYEPHRSIVIFTHYSPTALKAANDIKHINDYTHVRSAFTTDISNQICWTSSHVRLWAFGHTHFNCDFEDPRTGKRVVANQKGYCRTELITFNVAKVVSINTNAYAGKKSSKIEGGQENSKHRSRGCVIL